MLLVGRAVVPALRTTRLTKDYGSLRALDAVDLEVERGEFFGLLGPNGAGKSTLISVLSTMLAPTSGKAEVVGFDVMERPAEVRKRIGVVFQDPSLDEELTGRENLEFHARLYHVPRGERDRRIQELLAIVELESRQNESVRGYSGGMRRRLELARGLLHDPEVLFLDEPTLGLDPQTRAHVWAYIRRLNKERHVTMVLTTHYMDEADSLCNRLAIIDHGRFVAQGSPAQLKSALRGDVVHLRLEGPHEGVQQALGAHPRVRAVRASAEGLQLEVEDGATLLPALLETVKQSGGKVTSVQLQPPSLNDVFMQHTGRAIRDDTPDAQERRRIFHRGHRK